MTRSAVVGAVIGVAVAALARVWMRLIASEPEFTWGGTIAIAAMFTLLGLLSGLVGAALASGRSGWWRIAALPGLGAFLAQGIVGLWIADRADLPPGPAIAVIGGLTFGLVAVAR